MSRIRSTVRDTELERYLSDRGVAFDVLATARHAELEHAWNAIYGDVWRLGQRHRRQARAVDSYLKQVAREFVIVPFLGDSGGPHSLGKPEPRTCAYTCHGAGKLPDLASFANLDFFVAPPDLSWTLLHTHEDNGLGGPYYIERDWLTPPIRNSPSSRAWLKRRGRS